MDIKSYYDRVILAMQREIIVASKAVRMLQDGGIACHEGKCDQCGLHSVVLHVGQLRLCPDCNQGTFDLS